MIFGRTQPVVIDEFQDLEYLVEVHVKLLNGYPISPNVLEHVLGLKVNWCRTMNGNRILLL